MCVLFFFCAVPTEKVLSSFSAATSDNICSKKRDVKNIFATQKVGLGKGVAYIYTCLLCNPLTQDSCFFFLSFGCAGLGLHGIFAAQSGRLTCL